MARIRTIKPEFWTDEDMSGVSEPAALLAIALLNYADDDGYFNANVGLIRAACFPLREPSRSIPNLLRELSESGYLMLGKDASGKNYGRVVNFSKHQTINKKTDSKIKELLIVWEGDGNATGGLPEDYPLERKGKEQGKESIVADATGMVGVSPPENKKPPNPKKEVLNGHQAEFDEFYGVFPLHRGRGQAERAYLTAIKIADPQILLDGARRYAAQNRGKDPKYIAHPATWLNGKRWLDEDPRPPPTRGGYPI